MGKSKAKQGGLNEVEAFMAEQLADEGTITKEEAHAFAVEMGVPESMMDSSRLDSMPLMPTEMVNSMPEKLRLPWSTWVLTRMSSGQLRMSSLLPLRLSSLEMEESPRRRLLVPSLPGLTNKVSPSHRKHGTSWRLLSMKLMPMVMCSYR